LLQSPGEDVAKSRLSRRLPPAAAGFIKNYAFARAAFPRSAAHRHCAARWLQAS